MYCFSMQTFADIIGLWPNAVALADDIRERPVTVRAWKRRGSIPAGRWLAVVRAANQRGHPVTLEVFAQIADLAHVRK